MTNSLRSFKTEGIIIKRRNFGEADRILTVFTKRNGKIQVKASGVRKITSRRSSHIEPLNYSILSFYKGRSLILTEAQTLENFSLIKDDLTKVGFAYHICELVDGLCADNQENDRVFGLLLTILRRLSIEKNIVEIIHEFEIDLLVQLGFYKYSALSKNLNTAFFIENILERKLKSRQIIPRLIS